MCAREGLRRKDRCRQRMVSGRRAGRALPPARALAAARRQQKLPRRDNAARFSVDFSENAPAGTDGTASLPAGARSRMRQAGPETGQRPVPSACEPWRPEFSATTARARSPMAMPASARCSRGVSASSTGCLQRCLRGEEGADHRGLGRGVAGRSRSACHAPPVRPGYAPRPGERAAQHDQLRMPYAAASVPSVSRMSTPASRRRQSPTALRDVRPASRTGPRASRSGSGSTATRKRRQVLAAQPAERVDDEAFLVGMDATGDQERGVVGQPIL